MSTNYYFRNKEEYRKYQTVMSERSEVIRSIIQQLEEWNGNVYSLYPIELKLEEVAATQYEKLHIGKRSVGWKPLFEKQTHYSSVKELESFYLTNTNQYDIVNEYEVILSWDDLYNELIMHQGSYDYTDEDIYKDSEGYAWCTSQFD